MPQSGASRHDVEAIQSALSRWQRLPSGSVLWGVEVGVAAAPPGCVGPAFCWGLLRSRPAGCCLRRGRRLDGGGGAVCLGSCVAGCRLLAAGCVVHCESGAAGSVQGPLPGDESRRRSPSRSAPSGRWPRLAGWRDSDAQAVGRGTSGALLPAPCAAVYGGFVTVSEMGRTAGGS